MKIKLLMTFICIINLCQSQITFIPDQEFEQDLIDQNIDSDGIINGQVFTDDIENLTDLTLFNNLTDVTGLHDFSELKNLEIHSLYLPFESNQILDLTANVMLEKLTMYGGDDAISHQIEKIDLSENPNINQILVPGIWPLRQIDLKTDATDVSNLDIDISIGFPLQPGNPTEVLNENLFCIKVTDEAAANAGTGVYSTWTITAESNPYYFSETCTLNTERFKDIKVSIYPNPAVDVLNFDIDNFQTDNITIYDINGRPVKIYKDMNQNSIDVNALESGLYIIHFESEIGTLKKKFLKK